METDKFATVIWKNIKLILGRIMLKSSLQMELTLQTGLLKINIKNKLPLKITYCTLKS